MVLESDEWLADIGDTYDGYRKYRHRKAKLDLAA